MSPRPRVAPVLPLTLVTSPIPSSPVPPREPGLRPGPVGGPMAPVRRTVSVGGGRLWILAQMCRCVFQPWQGCPSFTHPRTLSLSKCIKNQFSCLYSVSSSKDSPSSLQRNGNPSSKLIWLHLMQSSFLEYDFSVIMSQKIAFHTTVIFMMLCRDFLYCSQ